MNPMCDEGLTAEKEYERHFAALAKLAKDLKFPDVDAEELIDEILVSTLVRRHIEDIEGWVAAAFTTAVNERKGGTIC